MHPHTFLRGTIDVNLARTNFQINFYRVMSHTVLKSRVSWIFLTLQFNFLTPRFSAIFIWKFSSSDIFELALSAEKRFLEYQSKVRKLNWNLLKFSDPIEFSDFLLFMSFPKKSSMPSRRHQGVYCAGATIFKASNCWNARHVQIPNECVYRRAKTFLKCSDCFVLEKIKI